MVEFKCLFCQDNLKDGDLICKTSCSHVIHEWCIETMKRMNEHHCKNCKKLVTVFSLFETFDQGKYVTIKGLPIIIEKLDTIIKLIASRENKLSELTKTVHDMSDKVEGLQIEHHALKFEKNEMDKRLKKIESDNNLSEDD